MQYLFKNQNKQADIKIKTNTQPMDYLNLSYDQNILCLLAQFGSIKENGTKLETETVIFSDYIHKANTWKTWQRRILLITDKSLYNLIPGDLSRCRRRIPLNKVGSLIISQKSDEFLIHVPSEYDYRLISKRKLDIMKVLTKLYSKNYFKSLNVELTALKSLKNVCLTRAKAKKLRNLKFNLTHIVNKVENLNITDNEEKVSSTTSSNTEYFDTTSSSFNNKLTPEDFIPLMVLGRGSFGKVMLVKRKDKSCQTVYAMKSLHKESIILRNQKEHTKYERCIMSSITHPFLIKLYHAFQTSTKLYFIMEFLKGGELFHHLKKSGRFSNTRTMLYTAEIVLGVGYLHKNHIIYRDLKPENILLDEYGHICLTDFGLSKITKSSERTNTFCGTPEYLAPEVLSNKGHDKSVDWWSLGILIYEMLVGAPPFYCEDVKLMYERIKKEPLTIPHYVKPQASELIYSLVQRDVKKRLGFGKEDYKAIMPKQFFHGLDWNHVINKRYIPEFIPETTKFIDTNNFDEEFTSEPVVDSVLPESKLDHENIKFSNFTYNGESVLKS